MVITALSLLGLLSCVSSSSATTFQIVKDTDTTVIDYEPPDSWKHLPGDCDGCSFPPSDVLLSNNGTWTNGTNIFPTKDADDKSSSKVDISLLSQKDGGKKGGSDNDSGQSNSGPDSDDPNFVPTPVTLTFRFNASSFVLHALIPSFILPNDAPSNTNISFMLDGISTGPAFTFTPSAQGQQFQNTEVLRLSGLSNAQHVVVGSLAPGSIFIVSYVNLTLEDAGSVTSSSSPESISNDRLATSASSSPTSNAPKTTTKKDVVSFAAAIGSVVGVLSALALGTCLSLCCRRRKARKRAALLRAEEEAAEIREFGGRVQGPRPFRPRYFPGTLPPFDPDEPEVIPPAYESGEGESIMISPLPPPPHPLIQRRDSLQVREVSNAAPVSIAPVASSPPLSLRRSSVISLVSPNYPAAVSEGSSSQLESPGVDGSISRPTESSEGPDIALPSRRNIPLESREMREDEISDSESGTLLPSDARERSPTRQAVVDIEESGEEH